MRIRPISDSSRNEREEVYSCGKADSVVVRQESFGGTIFTQKSGLMLELDREAFFFLLNYNATSNYGEMRRYLEKEFQRTVNPREMWKLARKLFKLGIISTPTSPQSKEFSKPSWPETGYLSAPEVVHLAVTHRCNLDCPHCYVGEDYYLEEEMSLTQIGRLVDRLSELRVFQIAIGGGEPFLRPDLPEVVDLIRKGDIIPNITTNGTLLTRSTLERIKDKIGRLQISFDSGDVSKRIGLDVFAGVPFGINVILTKENIARIEDILSLCSRLGAENVTLLRPKPPFPDLGPTEYLRLSERLGELVKKFEGIQITIDCALSFLMKDVSPPALAWNGIRGCSAGESFVVIMPNGDVYPCSHLADSGYFVGNVMREDFARLWNESLVLRKFREFRKNEAFLRTSCGKCPNVKNCGGCRAIVQKNQGDFYGEDPACLQRKGRS